MLGQKQILGCELVRLLEAEIVLQEGGLNYFLESFLQFFLGEERERQAFL